MACSTRYEYDEINRIEKMVEAPVTLSKGELCYPTTTYYYDSHNNLIGTTDTRKNSGEYGAGVISGSSLVARWKLDEVNGTATITTPSDVGQMPLCTTCPNRH